MEIRPLTLRAAAAVLALIAAAACPAAPPSIAGLATNRDLAPDEKAAIQAYAEFWGAALADGAEDPAAADDARQRLLDPLAVGNATELFRTEYGRALKDSLDRTLRSDSIHISVNAIIVTSGLGTERALDRLVSHASSRFEDRWQVRLRAAAGAVQLLEGNTLRPAAGQKIAGAARRLRDAARSEEHPRVLNYQLQAIFTADLAPLSDAQHRQTRQHLAEALTSTAERAAAAASVREADALCRAAHDVLGDLLGRLLGMRELTDQQAFGRQIGPCLYQFLNVPTTWWSDAQAETSRSSAFKKNISASEVALRRIDRYVRPGEPTPDTRLADAWEADDPDAYAADLKLWQDLVSQRPYGE